MGYGTTLELLADPTRRVLVERLRGGPRPVGDLADGLPVSRPAVSKHLKLMLDAGLVSVTRDGTKRLYSLDLRGLDELRRYVDGFWDGALASFKEAAEKRRH
jgi:DNA-binding transcriptional ArsR family regulator